MLMPYIPTWSTWPPGKRTTSLSMPTCRLSTAPGGHHQTTWNTPPLYFTDEKLVRCFRVESQTCAYLYPDAHVCACVRVCVSLHTCVCVHACPCLKCIICILMEVNDWVFLLIYCKQGAVPMERGDIWVTSDTVVSATLSQKQVPERDWPREESFLSPAPRKGRAEEQGWLHSGTSSCILSLLFCPVRSWQPVEVNACVTLRSMADCRACLHSSFAGPCSKCGGRRRGGLQVRGKCFFLEEWDLPASTEDAVRLGTGAGEAAASGSAYMSLLTRLCSRGFGRCLKLYSWFYSLLLSSIEKRALNITISWSLGIQRYSIIQQTKPYSHGTYLLRGVKGNEQINKQVYRLSHVSMCCGSK